MLINEALLLRCCLVAFTWRTSQQHLSHSRQLSLQPKEEERKKNNNKQVQKNGTLHLNLILSQSSTHIKTERRGETLKFECDFVYFLDKYQPPPPSPPTTHEPQSECDLFYKAYLYIVYSITPLSQDEWSPCAYSIPTFSDCWCLASNDTHTHTNNTRTANEIERREKNRRGEEKKGEKWAGRHKFRGFDARTSASSEKIRKEPGNDVAPMHLSDKAITGGATPRQQRKAPATATTTTTATITDEYSSRSIESRKYPSTFFLLLLFLLFLCMNKY